MLTTDRFSISNKAEFRTTTESVLKLIWEQCARNKSKSVHNENGYWEGILARLGQVDTICRDVWWQHVKTMGYPPIPHDTDFEFYAIFNVSSTEKPFIYYDTHWKDQVIFF